MDNSLENLHNLTATMKALSEDADKQNDLMALIGSVINMEDDQFEILSPGIMQSFQQSVNNPNDKIGLVQSLNAIGAKAEDLTDAFMQYADEVDNITELSKQKRDFLKEILATLANAINDTEGIAKRNVAIAIELCHPDAKVPQYAHISDSGADVYALEDITIKPGETVLVPTGFKVALPPGFELQVRPKSGRALKTKLRVANTPGTIDQGYRDEVKIIIENIEPPIKDVTVDDDGRVTSILYGSDYTIGKGEKFCQIVLNEVPKAAFYTVANVMEIDEENRQGGFGSTSIYSKDDSRYGTDIT